MLRTLLEGQLTGADEVLKALNSEDCTHGPLGPPILFRSKDRGKPGGGLDLAD